ncbi:MAG: hypothetical protein WDM91_14765 [Rhizomicrobium sp.]
MLQGRIAQAPWTGAAIAAAGFILAGSVAAIAVNWPGHLSYDSILQLLQGRTGLYNTWHPPVMAWLLGLFDAVVPGAGLFVVFDVALGFGAFFGVLLLAPDRARWRLPALAAIFVLSPQLLLYQGLVWKDVLFADAGVAGFVCLAHAFLHWDRRRRSGIWLAASVLLLSLAATTRQNGMILLPFAATAVGWTAAAGHGTWRRAALLGGGFLVATLGLALAANALLDLRSNGDSGPAEQLHLLQIYDLSGAVARDPAIRLDILADDDPELERAIRGDGARLYTPMRNDPIASSPTMQAALRDADTDALGAEWRSLVVRHPWTYLEVRAADFYWILLTPDVAASRPVFVGVEGPAPELHRLGIAPRRDARDVALDRYGKAFFGTPVFSHAFFVLAAGASLWVLLRRRRTADVALAAMLASAFAFAASFFAISISCDYRYLYVLDLSAMVALFYLALDWRRA